ncbi:MAG TPA: HDOD domain-containing protein [Steroidobacteraceae bacterium]|nr:HDOD domain-containing protein [Steroidobacteraceae bacterium]
MIWALSLLLAATACVFAGWPALRRTTLPGGARLAGPPGVASELPFNLRDLPEPPVLQPAPGQDCAQAEPPVAEVIEVPVLDSAEVLRRLRGLELGADLPAPSGEPDPAQERVIAAALAAIGDPSSQRQYFPRRPNLLPELMRAINDEGVSVRQLVPIVARDPSLVGNLLKVANSSYYRVTQQAVETIERALVILGSDGLRSVMAAALMQPIFQVSGAGGASRFPEVVWEHAVRSAHAAIPHAALVERVNPFAAELLTLISGLAEIVLFRAILEHCPRPVGGQGVDPQVIASILDSQSASFAWHIGADWRLSEEMLAALEEQMISSSEPATALGRSLRFGRCAGALAVLHANSCISDASVRVSLPPSGLSPAHLESMLKRLLRPHEDPRTLASQVSSARGSSVEQASRAKRGASRYAA